jgi:hypothetical protein
MLAGGVSLHFAVHQKLETLTKSRYLKTDREKNSSDYSWLQKKNGKRKFS